MENGHPPLFDLLKDPFEVVAVDTQRRTAFPQLVRHGMRSIPKQRNFIVSIERFLSLQVG